MKVASLFTGIAGLDEGLRRAGMEIVFRCEIDRFRRRVLGGVVHPDIRTVTEIPPVDLVCGGFPCTDVSVAGKKEGLDGPESGLFFEFVRILDFSRPEWVLIENVPGLLESNKGEDFDLVLRSLAELGYGVGWRVLDSRFFGVPQLRRRVYVVGSRVGGRAGAERAAAVLGVGTCCDRHVAPLGVNPRDESRVARGSPSGVVGTLTRRVGLLNTLVVDRERPRSLSVTEYLRCQGFPDAWFRSLGTPRQQYAAVGDAVTVPVAVWIARRLLEMPL